MKARWIALWLSLACAGCGTVGERFKPMEAAPDNRALVYLYLGCSPFIADYMGNGQTGASVSVNGKSIGYLSHGTYIPLALVPGEYAFRFGSTWNWTHPTLKFNYTVGANETHYLEWTSRPDPVRQDFVWYEMMARDAEVAKPVLSGCLLEGDSYMKAKRAGFSR